MLLVGLRQTDEDGREECEDVSLNEGNQNFEQGHENGKEQRYYGSSVSENDILFSEDENNAQETQNDDVSCRDVGKQSHGERKWFGEHSQNLHNRHDRNRELQPPRHSRHIYHVLPILFVAAHVGYHKGKQSQTKRYGNVTRYICSSRKAR